MMRNRTVIRRVPGGRRVRSLWASVIGLLAVVLAITVVGCSGEEVEERGASESLRQTVEVSSMVSGGGAVEATGTPVRLVNGASEVVGPGGAGLLEWLPVDPEVVVLVEGSPNLGGRSFVGFGDVYEGAEGTRANPQPTFWAPLGTEVLAPVSGVVVGISVVWSGDESVMIAADGDGDWVWEVEHVIDVRVAVGDVVEAGQVVALVSDYDVRNTPGVGLVELGLLQGGNPPQHFCPFAYVDPDAEASIVAGLELMLRADADRMGLEVATVSGVVGCVTTEPIEG
jgi:hypothetical protein